MKKHWLLFKQKISTCSASLGNYISKHSASLLLWSFSITVITALFLLQKIDYAKKTFEMEKNNLILLHNQELIFDDYVNQARTITEQVDKIDEIGSKLLEAERIIRLQNEAIKNLINELRKAGAKLPKAEPQKGGGWT